MINQREQKYIQKHRICCENVLCINKFIKSIKFYDRLLSDCCFFQVDGVIPVSVLKAETNVVADLYPSICAMA